MELLDNKIGEITAWECLLSITKTENSVQQSRTAALLIVSNYILGETFQQDIYSIPMVKMKLAIYQVQVQQFF